MGTQLGYSGSRGKGWRQVREDADALVLEPSPDRARELVHDLLEAIKSDADSAPGRTDEGDIPQQDNAPQAPISARPHIRLPGGIGRVGGTAAGGGFAGGGGGGGSSRAGSNSRRGGRARLVSAGGAALAAGSALRTGDAATLRTLGLSLTELQHLDPVEQVQEILDTLIPDAGALEDAELRYAGAEALLTLADADTADVADVVRLLVTEYVFSALMTEAAAKLQHGDKANEDMLHEVIRAYADAVELPQTMLTVADFEAAIDQVYGAVEDLS